MKRLGDATPNYLLRNARENRGWTQEELAEKIGATCVTVSRWESGVTFPSRSFHNKLSALYGISIGDLGLLQYDKQITHHLEIQPQFSASSIVYNPITPRRLSSFFFNEPLSNLMDFYGRRRERDILLSRTYRRASTSIVGPRRSGKTWLCSYLRLIAAHEFGPRFRIGYLDATMPSCRTVMGFVNGAMEELGLSTSGPHKDLLRLEKGLKAARAQNIVSVLCIDEFEGFSNREEFTLDFFRSLRALTQTHNLVLIVISRQPISIISKDMETSDFFNVFEQISLSPFNRYEAREFIQEKSQQAQFTQEEIERFWHYSEEQPQQWPPLRLQLVGKMLQEEQHQPREGADYWESFRQHLEKTYHAVA